MKSDQMRMCCVTALVILIIVLSLRCMRKQKRSKSTCGHASTSAPISVQTPKDAPKQTPEHPQFIVYGYMSCPYTAKQVKYMEDNNIAYSFVDTKTEAGFKELSSVTGGGTGVPVIVNTASSQYKVGYTEL